MANSCPAAPQQQQQQPSGRPPFDDDARRSKMKALLAAGLQLVSRFLGFCALSWATVVLLGGFASDLRPLDFYLISALLLADGMRLFIVQTFSKLLSRALFCEPINRGQNFEFTDMHASNAVRLDLLAQILSLLLAIPSLVFTCICLVLATRGHSLSERIPSPSSSPGPGNLPDALLIFYTISLLNSTFAVLSSVLRPILRLSCHGNTVIDGLALCFSRPASPHQDSLIRYQEEIYKTAMETGLPEADQVDILEFAFTKLGMDCERNVRPPLIKKLKEDLITHLYERQHGIAMACRYLKGAGDIWKQIAAANLPGMWAEEKEIEGQMALFWALRERMYGAGKDGESALNSVEALGRKWAASTKPYPFLVKEPGTGATVVETLVELLLKPLRPTLLFQVRAFEACCRNRQVRHYFYEEEMRRTRDRPCAALQALVLSNEVAQQGLAGPRHMVLDEGLSKLQKLCCKLQSVAVGKGGATWTASNIYAGNAMVALLCDGGQEEMGQEVKDCLADIVRSRINPSAEPTRADAYFSAADVELPSEP
ncbi:hypothetical protein L7F22_014588 [Adiantum nelumboides]|nr:hypothetical protein [Adiantum nelumboides]